MLKLISLSVAATAVAVGVFVTLNLTRVPEKPNIDYKRWWGQGERPSQEDTSIRPFKIEFNDTMIKDLRERLRNRRPLTDNLEGIKAEYGINIKYLQRTLDYWEKQYDFKRRAELLNKFEHYKTIIQGLDLHFIRAKPKETKGLQVLPILLIHGWPSSSKEFIKIIPMLTSPRTGYNFIFDVVAVDLPGFGFSQGTTKPGLTPAQMGVILHNLMKRLGFRKYFIQSGDWGSQVGSHMATLFPDDIRGYHTNMPMSSMPISYLKIIIGSLMPSLLVDKKHMDRIYPLIDTFRYIARESGYFHMQATKPDTLGVSLTDSPSGLAAYIMEKMAICTNRDQLDQDHGGLEGLDIDDVLDTITIVWTNNAIVTSMRIYAEGFARAAHDVLTLHKIPTYVPTAVINFKYEVVYQPDWALTDKYRNLVHSTTLDFGGHFAALHTPKELADDVFDATVEFIKQYSRYK